MAADYNKPVTTDNYADILTQLRDNIAAAQTMLNDLTGVANIPTDAVRYDQTAKKLQTYNGTSFVDSVLSPAGGGTGITNWAKASTAEAEAGTADKYPDAAGVLASINANAPTFSNVTLVWSGSAASVDFNTAIGGSFPGNGFYIVDGAAYSCTIYVASGFDSMSAGGVYILGNSLNFSRAAFIGSVMTLATLGVNPTASAPTQAATNITAIYKVE